MKKFTLLFLTVIYIFCCFFVFTACNNPNTPPDTDSSSTSSQQEQPTNVLIVDGDGNQATNMQTLISEMGYTSTIVTPAKVPENAIDLAEYSLVILMNVNVADLPKDYGKELDVYVKAYGGGLFTTGGDRTYSYGGMYGTWFDSMLPVNVVPEDNSTNGIMFVVESSGSMYYDFNDVGNGDCFYDESSAGFQNTPMNYVKTGLREAAANTFDKNDYLGIMHFGKSQPPQLDLALTPGSQRGAFITAVSKIKSIKGTNWSLPLQQAAEHLRDTSYKISKKQIIFITDSSPAELSGSDKSTDFAALTKSFEDNWGITVSVIAVNGCNSIDPSLMNNITTAVDKKGYKRFYNCTTPAQFIKALSDECKTASAYTTDKTENFEVEITSAAANCSIFDGVVDGSDYPQKGIMPNISRYNNVTVKDNVEALLVADNQANGTHDTLYAQWSCGNGMVGSFASDLGIWAKEYYSDPEAKLFLKNVIKNFLMRKKG